jgi:GH24 family phage-related lysozyme (muramidase)
MIDMTLKELLIRHEGVRAKLYLDSMGIKTIGCGWNMDAWHLPGPVQSYFDEHRELNDDCIDALLDISIQWATADCHKLFPEFDKFTENRRMALVDFLFNLGLGRASKFVHMIHSANTGRWQDAAKELRNSAWAHQVQKERVDDLTEMIEAG